MTREAGLMVGSPVGGGPGALQPGGLGPRSPGLSAVRSWKLQTGLSVGPGLNLGGGVGRPLTCSFTLLGCPGHDRLGEVLDHELVLEKPVELAEVGVELLVLEVLGATSRAEGGSFFPALTDKRPRQKRRKKGTELTDVC
jgi:hypothetical protein